MRGFFEPIDHLLKTVYEFCEHEIDECELLLFEAFWITGGTRLQLNEFQAGAQAFKQAWDVLQQTIKKGVIGSSDDRVAIAAGLMGNGRLALNDFVDAESWYLRAFQLWEELEKVI